MRIGLLTDIHEEVGRLRTALATLKREGVDAIVQLGDAIDLFGPGRGSAEIAPLLAEAGVVGVWGNHDIGFCHEVPAEVRDRAEPHVLEYMATMRPRLELGGCHFSHVDPHLDPTDVLQIWMAWERPVTAALAAPSFAAVPHRVCFLGHYHRWTVTSDIGPVDWDATAPLVLDPNRRFLVVVGPIIQGEFGLYETETGCLLPFRC